MTSRKRSRKPKAPAQRVPEAMRNVPRPPPLGGRQGCLDLARGGGGYQDSCKAAVRGVGRWRAAGRADPRIDELRRVGIGRVWVRLAEVLGFEVFIQAWQVLASDASVLDERSRVLVPSPARYQRYQRNQMIIELAAAGHDPGDIADMIKRLLDEPITKARVQRLLRQRFGEPDRMGRSGQGSEA